MANSIAVSDVHSLLRKADSIIRSSAIYEDSKELDTFKDLVVNIKQKHGNWLRKAKDVEEGSVDSSGSGSGRGQPAGRTWECLEEASGKAQEEVTRLSKLRLSAGIRTLMCNCAYKKCSIHRVHFPEDLTDSFLDVSQLPPIVCEIEDRFVMVNRLTNTAQIKCCLNFSSQKVGQTQLNS
jgi:hypothetical protein